MDNELYRFLSEWCYPGPYRSIGSPYQKIHKNSANRLLYYIKNDVTPVYLSVNPRKIDDTISCIDRIFFDFDNPDKVRYAWYDAKKLNESLLEFYNAGALTVFSGSKGYHVYVYLQNPYIGTPKQCKSVYKKLQDMIIAGENYKTLDKGVIGDVKRCARVPYSSHHKTGELTVPVTMDLDPYKLLPGYSKVLRDTGIPVSVIKTVNENLKKKDYPVYTREYNKEKKDLRPCIKNVFNYSSVHDGSHLMRLAAVAEMNADGYSVEQMVNKFRDMNGFDEDKTRYFVEHAVKRGYKPFKCKTIRENGGCLPNCPIR